MKKITYKQAAMISVFCVVLLTSTRSISQVVPDQNKFYAIINKATDQVLTAVPPQYPGLLNLHELMGTTRFAFAGYKEDNVNWKFNKLDNRSPLFNIQGKNLARNIFLPSGTHAVGNRLFLSPIRAGTTQQFYLISTGEPDTYYISSAESGLVLDGTTTGNTKADGSTFIRQKQLSGADTQKWILHEN